MFEPVRAPCARCSPRSPSWRRSPFAACGETQDDERVERARPRADGRPAPPIRTPTIKEGLKTVSIPKQLGNPYEEFEHSGVDEALEELGGSNQI